MNEVTSKKEYKKMIDDFNGHYPIHVTTDGIEIKLEHHNRTDQFYFEMVPVEKINCSDNFSSFSRINKIRKLVKSGLRGDDLELEIVEQNI